ncbi:Kef-type K+ transport system, membrane component KefB [Candidatus Methanophagaceae archaeon]|nr:Kef-type K+ transport system, membrane component KefB [Methanophagales archaeon]
MAIENVILLIGIALTLGFVIGTITHHLRLTAIVGYIVVGILLGPAFHVVELSSHETNIIVSFTLGLIAFIIGGSFTIDFLKMLGKSSIVITLIQSFATFLIITLGVFIFTRDWTMSLLLGSIGVATAPAGTIASLHDCKARRGTLSKMTTAIVGLDDGVAILFFVIAIALVKVILGDSLSVSSIFIRPLIEILGAVALGIAIGTLLAYSAKKVKGRESILVMSLAGILMCTGLAEIFHFSSILACMFLGATFINLVPEIGRTFFEIVESILPPIYIIFFIVAGLKLRPDLLIGMGIIGILYIGCRITGKVGGAFIGSKLVKVEPFVQKYLGLALLSQAGVAVGLAVTVTGELSAYGKVGADLGAMAITIIAATTVVFEIIGPIGVRYAVNRAGEAESE